MWDLIVSIPDHCLSFYFSKCPKLLLNAHFGPQIHALDSILPTVNIEIGLKGFFTVYGGQHSKRYQSDDKINILESPKTVFFSKTGVISQTRETGFLFLTVKLIKNDTFTTSTTSLCCEASFKVPISPLQKPVSDRFQLICTLLYLIFIL